MKNLLLISSILFFSILLACKTNTIAKNSDRCTPPSKRYTKELDLKVKASIDSLKVLSSANLDAGLTQKVIKLTDYSTEGLDLDLVLFRICEMAHNENMSPEQTQNLINIAVSTWNSKKNSPPSVINNGINNGVIGGIIQIPPDKEIPLEQNSVIQQVTDPEFMQAYKGKLVFEAKPRQGNWYQPFFAYPMSEDSLVKGKLAPKILGAFVMMGALQGEAVLKFPNGDSLKVRTMSGSNGTPANPDFGYLFICDKKPSVLYFGDSQDPRKQFATALR